VDRFVGGYRTVRSTTGCWHSVNLLVLYNLTVIPFVGLIPIYVHSQYHGGTSLAGLVASAQGVGAIIGGVSVTIIAHRHARSFMIERLIVALAISLAIYAVAPNPLWVAVGSALLGASGAGFWIATSAILQRDAPAASRGRVMSIMQAATGISYGIGLLVIGIIGDTVNLHVAFGFGAVMMLAGFALITWRSRHWRTAIDGRDPVVGPSIAMA